MTAGFRVDLPREEDTIAFAERFAKLVRGGDLIVLSGPLGAGKTFFSRALCHALGLPADEPVTSPTFTLVHEYPTDPPIRHADLYRLRSEDEVFELGLETGREAGDLILVEWGAPYVELLGGDALCLELSLVPRALSLEATGARSRDVLRALLAEESP